MQQPSAVRLLYIDDDPWHRALGAASPFARSGCDVRVASERGGGRGAGTGSEAFDAIALDHYMPGQDGLEVLARAARPARHVPPVIFVTAAEEPRIAVAALKEGAADYVVKDVQGAFLDLLGTAVRHAIEQRRMWREKEAAQRLKSARAATGWSGWPRSRRFC